MTSSFYDKNTLAQGKIFYDKYADQLCSACHDSLIKHLIPFKNKDIFKPWVAWRYNKALTTWTQSMCNDCRVKLLKLWQTPEMRTIRLEGNK